ncbi:hypothetical protein M514_09597 [Trichuris suis]|uniref:Uncharacterized protein n=1 Tax=Trichuris suis TaxID=68888 RepID=A0A085LWZ0_9BILA|nr:hypothetical protein M513_09597 [Trichuris suis]KFD65660.1 hypothetical protein M514_09597 [Trichuris suis]KHJ48477.1 hypothetical protein D918_00779 [Trichuris suis]
MKLKIKRAKKTATVCRSQLKHCEGDDDEVENMWRKSSAPGKASKRRIFEDMVETRLADCKVEVMESYNPGLRPTVVTQISPAKAIGWIEFQLFNFRRRNGILAERSASVSLQSDGESAAPGETTVSGKSTPKMTK